jgi:hypothetical protein
MRLFLWLGAVWLGSGLALVLFLLAIRATVRRRPSSGTSDSSDWGGVGSPMVYDGAHHGHHHGHDSHGDSGHDGGGDFGGGDSGGGDGGGGDGGGGGGD